jgi:integrase
MKVLTNEQLKNPSKIHFFWIMGILIRLSFWGLLRSEEVLSLTFENIEFQQGDIVVLTLEIAKVKRVVRLAKITTHRTGKNLCVVEDLRSLHAQCTIKKGLKVQFKNIAQVFEQYSSTITPQKMASYVSFQIGDTSSHTFRRSGAQFLLQVWKIDQPAVMRHGGWVDETHFKNYVYGRADDYYPNFF